MGGIRGGPGRGKTWGCAEAENHRPGCTGEKPSRQVGRRASQGGGQAVCATRAAAETRGKPGAPTASPSSSRAALNGNRNWCRRTRARQRGKQLIVNGPGRRRWSKPPRKVWIILLIWRPNQNGWPRTDHGDARLRRPKHRAGFEGVIQPCKDRPRREPPMSWRRRLTSSVLPRWPALEADTVGQIP